LSGIWLTDITYIPTGEGRLYLAGHKDLFTGEIVGYAMAKRMTKRLVVQSLLSAVAAKRPVAGLIHHSSDRGSRYSTRQAAMQDITEYIEIFYNRQRKQAGRGFLSPAAFERLFYEKRLAA
jgi:transposase InsO family protein